MASRNVSDTFEVAGKSVFNTKGIFWRQCNFINCTVYFSEIKWFWEHFEPTAYKKCSFS
jgi:hypothetical protein